MSRYIFPIFLLLFPLYLLLGIFYNGELTDIKPSDILKSSYFAESDFSKLPSLDDILNDVASYFPESHKDLITQFEEIANNNENMFEKTLSVIRAVFESNDVIDFLKILIGIIVFIFSFISYIFKFIIIFFVFITGGYRPTSLMLLH